MDLYLRHPELTARSVPMPVLIAKVQEEFRRLDANERFKRYTESVEDALRTLEEAFGERVVASITALDTKDWLPRPSRGHENPQQPPGLRPLCV
ncbi:MAG: hypothetical protein JOY92_07765 [Verrucomicrobia bacterium]|nr:hypothetical protein [Verrucomicrobiota bacterium]